MEARNTGSSARSSTPWFKSPFIRALLPELFEAAAPGEPSEPAVMEALFKLIVTMATRVMGTYQRRRGRTVEEIVSDVLMMFIEDRAAGGFDPSRPRATPRGYLLGLIWGVARGNHRRFRVSVAFESIEEVHDERAESPLSRSSENEVIELLRAVWPALSARRRDAIRAQLGPMFGTNDETEKLVKDYSAKHRGLRQLKRLVAALGVFEV